jgi:plastocyanin
MKNPLLITIACFLLALAAGCGSSNSTSSSASGDSTTTATSTAAAATSATNRVGTSSIPAAGSTSPGATLKGDTTPKFAAPSPSAPVQSGVVQIAYRNIAIEPDTVRVKLGSTIKWTNYDSVKANVTSVSGPQRFASANFGEGGTFAIKAEKPGVIHYECTLFPTTMNGTIEVLS